MSTDSSKRQARVERQARREAEKRKARRQDRLYIVLGGVIVLLAIFGVVWALSGGDEVASDKIETGDPEITGEALPPLPQEGADPAVGMQAPSVSGTNFDGDPVTLHEEGETTIAVFLAHWCPHCNREVPVIVDEFDPETMPDDVTFVGIATSTREGQPNYPPSQWLESRNWEFPVLVDSEQSEITQAFGIPSYPGFAVIGPDGRILLRASGALGAERLNALVDLAAEAAAG